MPRIPSQNKNGKEKWRRPKHKKETRKKNNAKTKQGRPKKAIKP